MFTEAGIIVIATFISPLQSSRDFIKDLIGNEIYIEVFLRCSLEECIKRDVKGLYKKAIDKVMERLAHIK